MTDTITEHADHTLHQGEPLNQPIGTLSGGQRQCVAIAPPRTGQNPRRSHPRRTRQRNGRRPRTRRLSHELQGR